MDHCCEQKGAEISQLQARHSRVLYAVLWINAAMFVIEGGAGLAAHSTALLADALDMLGDALVYGFSLFVLDGDVLRFEFRDLYGSTLYQASIPQTRA